MPRTDRNDRPSSIRLRLTPLGAKSVGFLAALTVAFYVSPYTNLFFLLLMFLVTLLAMNVWWTVGNLRGIDAQLADPGPVPAGTSIQVEARARANFGSGTRFQLEIRARLPRGVITETAQPSDDEPWWARPLVRVGTVPRRRTAVIIRQLDGGDEVAEAGFLPSCRRGIHELESVTVSSSFPLGLVRASREILGPTSLVVHPAPLDGSSVRDRGSSNDNGSDESLFAQLEQGNSNDRLPAGLRPWIDGDPVQSVDWRASARRSEMIVREYEFEQTRCLEVVFDRRCEQGVPDAAFDRALTLLTTLALRQQARKEALTVHSQQTSATYGADGSRPIRDLLTWLAACSALPMNAGAPTGRAAPTAVRLPRRGQPAATDGGKS